MQTLQEQSNLPVALAATTWHLYYTWENSAAADTFLTSSRMAHSKLAAA